MKMKNKNKHEQGKQFDEVDSMYAFRHPTVHDGDEFEHHEGDGDHYKHPHARSHHDGHNPANGMEYEKE